MTQNYRNQDYRDRDYRSGRDYRSAAGRDQEIGNYWSRNDRDEGQGDHRGFDQGRSQDRYAGEYEGGEGRGYQGRNQQGGQGSWQGDWQNRQQWDQGRGASNRFGGYDPETYGNQRFSSASPNRSYDDWGYGQQSRYAGRGSQGGYFGTEGSGGYGSSSGNYDNFRSSGSYGASGNAANYGSTGSNFGGGREYDSQWGSGSRYGSSSGSYGNYGYGGGSGGGSEAGAYRGESYRGKGPKGYARSDERLKEVICERLTEDHGIDASDITVDVTGQSVKLTGNIDDRRAKYEVEELIERIGGVKDIDNQLKVQSRTGEARGSDYSGAGASGTGSRGTSTDKSTGTSGTRHN